MSGKLYVVATPIGNLGDMTPRALDTLRAVDFIAAEDTRVTMKLMHHFDIHKPLVSYYEHNRRERGELIVGRITAGECCALVTDAGTPAISDPGCDLVALCREQAVEVVSVPGASALIAALSIAGIECGRFCFEGFLSVNKKNRAAHIAQLRSETRTMVFYEAPHKLPATLRDLHAALGERTIALCRELTKLHEEVVVCPLSEAAHKYEQTPPRGEFVLVLEGARAQDKEAAVEVDYLGEVAQFMQGGMSLMQAVKQVSRIYNTPKNPLYRSAVARFGDDGTL